MKKGFTLIEILISMAILAVLFGIALVAINPARQGSLARNTKRKNDVLAILNAVGQFSADNKGTLPIGLQTSALYIQKTNGVDLCSSLVTTYLAGLPVDPQINGGAAVSDCNSSYTTNYMIGMSPSDNRLIVTAPNAEVSVTIAVER